MVSPVVAQLGLVFGVLRADWEAVVSASLVARDMDQALERGALTVPAGLREGLLLYLRVGIRPGSFLCAVLQNDLVDACRRADPVSAWGLQAIVSFLDNFAPAPSYGSPAAFEAWIEAGRTLRRQEEGSSC